ncbi:GNAT family N-acetyltransferase, partial [Thermodesulfobacteriota bacterium]
MAYQGNDCVGYHGLLPGMLLIDGQLSKVYWATAFFVSPEIRGKGVGKRLLGEIKKLN